MTLFFASWPERTSLLLDAESPEAATEIATASADGEAPAVVRPLPPRVFAAEVFHDDEDDDGVILVVEPLPHVADALSQIEDANDAAIRDEGAADTLPPCGDTLEDEGGRVLSCEKPRGHKGDHEAIASDGARALWGDEGAADAGAAH